MTTTFNSFKVETLLSKMVFSANIQLYGPPPVPYPSVPYRIEELIVIKTVAELYSMVICNAVVADSIGTPNISWIVYQGQPVLCYGIEFCVAATSNVFDAVNKR